LINDKHRASVANQELRINPANHRLRRLSFDAFLILLFQFGSFLLIEYGAQFPCYKPKEATLFWSDLGTWIEQGFIDWFTSNPPRPCPIKWSLSSWNWDWKSAWQITARDASLAARALILFDWIEMGHCQAHSRRWKILF